MELAALANCLGVKTPSVSPHFQGVAIDSRKVQAGDLFYALSGEQSDGHAFVNDAARNGAVAAVVSQPIVASIPTLLVPDTRIALGQHAKAWRDQFDLPIAALTGSSGKTTVKQITATLLNEAGNTLATMGNFNNELGVPLTLLNLRPSHQFAVVELGANHIGEIAYTVGLTRPCVALVNNVGTAHLEGFGSVAGIAKAKSEIYSGLDEKGIAIINADDRFADEYRVLCEKHTQLTFGLQNKADITAHNAIATDAGWQFQLHLPSGEYPIQFGLPGRHNLSNALAAVAIAHALGLTGSQIQSGLQKVTGVPGRMQRKVGKQQAIVIDDTYNANPSSTKAAIDYLAGLPVPHLLILGDMGELGPTAELLHREVGEYAREKGISRLLTCGVYTAATAKGFGEAAMHFATQGELIAYLQQAFPKESYCLVKGSRSAKMENVVRVLVEG